MFGISSKLSFFFIRNAHYLDMRKHIIQNYRKKTKDKSAIPTFRESVDFVLDELKKMEAGVSKIMIDGHFMPYSRYVAFVVISVLCLSCFLIYEIYKNFTFSQVPARRTGPFSMSILYVCLV